MAVGGKSELLSEPSSVFRDHRLLSFDPGQVRRVTLDTGDHRLTVRGQGTAWWVDGFTRADPDRVDDLVMGLLDLRFDRIMALDRVAEPRAVVEIELEDGTVSELRVGERTPMGDLVNAPRATGMVFPESLALLQMGPTDLGDRHAIPISLERDTRVVIEVGDVSWQATRDGALWRSVDLDEQATWARLNALAQASIAYRLEPVEMLAEVAARVTIWRGESQKVIEVGPEGEDGFHRARDVDGGEPYRVRAAELTNLGLD